MTGRPEKVLCAKVLCAFVAPYPKDPSVLKIVRRVNSVGAVNFGTEIRKRYGEGSEMLVFPRKWSRKTVRIVKDYGRSKILRIRAP